MHHTHTCRAKWQSIRLRRMGLRGEGLKKSFLTLIHGVGTLWMIIEEKALKKSIRSEIKGYTVTQLLHWFIDWYTK